MSVMMIVHVGLAAIAGLVNGATAAAVEAPSKWPFPYDWAKFPAAWFGGARNTMPVTIIQMRLCFVSWLWPPTVLRGTA